MDKDTQRHHFEVELETVTPSHATPHKWCAIGVMGTTVAMIMLLVVLYCTRWHAFKTQPSIKIVFAQLTANATSNLMIPRTLHVVVEVCDKLTLEKIRGNMEYAAMSSFEVQCHDAPSRAAYVEAHLPSYAAFYNRLPLPVMKADIFRYMLLYEEGGFYLDDDVDLYPSFPNNFAQRSNQDLIVGWERRSFDKAIGTWCEDFGGMLCNSLSMYAFGAAPKHEALKDAIDSCKEYADTNKFDVENPQNMVLNQTGPAHFTRSVLKYVAVADVLGIEAFGCGQEHSNAPTCSMSQSEIWLRHRFEGKWRGQVGGTTVSSFQQSSMFF